VFFEMNVLYFGAITVVFNTVYAVSKGGVSSFTWVSWPFCLCPSSNLIQSQLPAFFVPIIPLLFFQLFGLFHLLIRANAYRSSRTAAVNSHR